jgi:protocatechuate 3,4-dioxygenase beta subunit
VCTCMRNVVLLVVALPLAQHGAAQDSSPKRDVRTAPLTVTGKALDDVGRPIAGATIYLVSTNDSPAKTLGQTTTDANGHYEFRDAPLPETQSAKPADQYQSGCFQVFGKAPDRAFAWRGMRFFYVDPKYAIADPQLRDAYRKDGFFAGDKIDLDLTFYPEERVYGRFVDEHGQPIAGVKLRIANCDFVDPTGKEDHRNFREFWAINQAADVMPEQLLATTNEDGVFEFKSVPPEVFCWLLIDHPEYAHVSLYTTTAAIPPAMHDDHPVVKLPVEMTLHAVRTIPVLVQLADSGQPAAGVRVSSRQLRASGNYASGTSDNAGRLTLKLPPGNYQLVGDPPRGTDYIRTTQDLIVEPSAGEQPATLQMQPGCVLILKAVDADSGAGIADVEFWHVTSELPATGKRGRFRMGVQSNTTTVDHPKSNADGELRVVVTPGAWEYGIGWNRLPAGYEFLDRQDAVIGRLLDLPAGQTVRAEFTLRKIAK